MIHSLYFEKRLAWCESGWVIPTISQTGLLFRSLRLMVLWVQKCPHNSSILSWFEPATPFRNRTQLIKVKIQRGRGSSASIMAKHISLGVGLVVNCKPPALTMGTRHTSPGLSIQLQLPVYPAYSILHCHIDIAFWLMGWDLNQYLLFNLPPFPSSPSPPRTASAPPNIY